MSNHDKDLVRMKHILDAILLIEEFTENGNTKEFFTNKMVQAAVVRQFEIIGEAAKNISEKTKQTFVEVEWRLMGDFRNLLIHQYFIVDEGEIWATVQNDIPSLKEQIEIAIKEIEQ